MHPSVMNLNTDFINHTTTASHWPTLSLLYFSAYISIPPYRRGDRSYHDLVDKIENLVEVGADTDTNDP